ncbi:hypothetical protein ACFOPX_02620 [Helicobacter baculiformis]|uniref:Lipoprotein n=1 Tax=Helicobacter baculiformis TaxID=427351 RepID=A0ABV7ZGX4_9HELI|nr:hypothetical protein [Helicobacter baculiformis]
MKYAFLVLFVIGAWGCCAHKQATQLKTQKAEDIQEEMTKRYEKSLLKGKR